MPAAVCGGSREPPSSGFTALLDANDLRSCSERPAWVLFAISLSRRLNADLVCHVEPRFPDYRGPADPIARAALLDSMSLGRHCQPSALHKLGSSSGLGSDNLSQPLTNSGNRPGDVEKRPPVTAARAHGWPAMANRETNEETQNAPNVGQLGTCGSGCAFNKLRGKRCGERVWLPTLDTFRTLAA